MRAQDAVDPEVLWEEVQPLRRGALWVLVLCVLSGAVTGATATHWPRLARESVLPLVCMVLFIVFLGALFRLMRLRLRVTSEAIEAMHFGIRVLLLPHSEIESTRVAEREELRTFRAPLPLVCKSGRCACLLSRESAVGLRLLGGGEVIIGTSNSSALRTAISQAMAKAPRRTGAGTEFEEVQGLAPPSAAFKLICVVLLFALATVPLWSASDSLSTSLPVGGAVLLMIGFHILISRLQFTIRVTDQALTTQLRPFQRRPSVLRLDDLSELQQGFYTKRDISGRRASMRGLAGPRAVRLTFPKGRKVFLSSTRAHELAQAIERLRDRLRRGLT